MDLRSIATVVLISGCASAPAPLTTAWYRCGEMAADEHTSCAFYRGHFLQVGVDPKEAAKTAASRAIFVDGRLVVVETRRVGFYWTSACPYDSSNSFLDAAVCWNRNFVQLPPAPITHRST